VSTVAAETAVAATSSSAPSAPIAAIPSAQAGRFALLTRAAG
jgi:hypothetical protein